MSMLISRFKEVKMDVISMFSEEDIAYCKKLQDELEEFKNFSFEYIEVLKSNRIKTSFLNSTSLEENYREIIKNAVDTMIVRIVQHFTKKYKVKTLCFQRIKEKGYDIRISYEAILKDILEQMQGLGFEELAIKEIRDNFRETLSFKKIKLGNNKITFENYVWYNESYTKISDTHWNSSMYKLFLALSLFDTGRTEMRGDFGRFLEQAGSYYHKLNLFDKNDYSHCEKVESFRLFKNKRLDIYFQSEEYARQFAKEFCGL